jgi:hypothetical protein
MVTLDLALSHRMIRPATVVDHSDVMQPGEDRGLAEPRIEGVHPDLYRNRAEVQLGGRGSRCVSPVQRWSFITVHRNDLFYNKHYAQYGCSD